MYIHVYVSDAHCSYISDFQRPVTGARAGARAHTHTICILIYIYLMRAAHKSVYMHVYVHVDRTVWHSPTRMIHVHMHMRTHVGMQNHAHLYRHTHTRTHARTHILFRHQSRLATSRRTPGKKLLLRPHAGNLARAPPRCLSLPSFNPFPGPRFTLSDVGVHVCVCVCTHTHTRTHACTYTHICVYVYA